MQPRNQPAEEPYEGRDLQLGALIRRWTEAQKNSLDLKLHGPLEAPGMDPTWILEMRGEHLEALVHLFYGPIVDVSVMWLAEDAMYVGAAEHFSDQQLASMLDDLAEAARCGVIVQWLRAAPPA